MKKRQKRLSAGAGILLLSVSVLTFLSLFFQIGGTAFLLTQKTLGIAALYLAYAGNLIAAILLFFQKKGKLLGIALSITGVAKLLWMIESFRLIKTPHFPAVLIVPLLSLISIGVLAAGCFWEQKTSLRRFFLIFAYLPVLCFLLTLIAGYPADFILSAAECLSYICIGAVLTGESESNPNKQEKIHNIGFIGSFCLIAGVFLSILIAVISILLYQRIYFFDGFLITSILWSLAFLLLIFGLISFPLAVFFNGNAFQSSTVFTENGSISLGKHIALCVFTFGIWYYIWIYRTTSFLNQAPKAIPYRPAVKLLLCIFLPFYAVYWFYQHGKRVDNMLEQNKLKIPKIETLALVLGIFLPFLSCIFIQDRINIICENKTTNHEIISATADLQPIA